MYDLNIISPVCADAQSIERAHKRVACSDTLLTKRGQLPSIDERHWGANLNFHWELIPLIINDKDELSSQLGS